MFRKWKLPPDLTICAVAELKREWLDQLRSDPKGNDSEGVEVDGSAVEVLDAAGLQLLASLKRTVTGRGGAFHLRNPGFPLAEAIALLQWGEALGTIATEAVE